ncbi:MAG: RHS repeat-associated core domain-containing protein, partial [Spirochaetota bacterium]
MIVSRFCFIYKESGLYYFGARYYDARMSRWISTDPAFIKFIPIGNKKNNEKLPAGGVFKSSNLAMFIYASNNPVMYIDPDGKWDDRVHFGNDEYGTLRWAQDVGFSREDAIKIAT